MIDIYKNNEEFEKLPNNEKRVLIAQDVLKYLEKGDLIPTEGSYFEIGDMNQVRGYNMVNNTIETFATLDPEGSFQDQVPNLPVCSVCAKGAILLCTVARRNQVTNKNASRQSNYRDEYILSKLLNGIFTPQQLCDIEGTFEAWRNFDTVHNEDIPANERMVLIMKNIIRNNGEFIPSQDFNNKDEEEANY